MSEAAIDTSKRDELALDLKEAIFDEARGGPRHMVVLIDPKGFKRLRQADPDATLSKDSNGNPVARIQTLNVDGSQPHRVTLWLAVDAISRHYGGSEEGGWWYDEGEMVWSEPVRVFYHQDRATFLPPGEWEFLNLCAAELVQEFQFGTDYRSSMRPRKRDFRWRIVSSVPKNWSNYGPYS